MTLVRDFCLSARTQDSTQATWTDVTNYGSPEILRNSEAHKVIIAKMDENQGLVFNTSVTEDGTKLTSLNYKITQNADGAYRLFLFVPAFYTPATNYIGQITTAGVINVWGSIVYGATTQTFYLATANSINIEPGVTSGWANYWTVLYDFTTQVNNTTSPAYIFDDVITFRYEDCLMETLDAESDKILDGTCVKIDQLMDTLSMQLLLDGIRSLNWQGKAPRAEVVTQAATKKYCC